MVPALRSIGAFVWGAARAPPTMTAQVALPASCGGDPLFRLFLRALRPHTPTADQPLPNTPATSPPPQSALAATTATAATAAAADEACGEVAGGVATLMRGRPAGHSTLGLLEYIADTPQTAPPTVRPLRIERACLPPFFVSAAASEQPVVPPASPHTLRASPAAGERLPEWAQTALLVPEFESDLRGIWAILPLLHQPPPRDTQATGCSGFARIAAAAADLAPQLQSQWGGLPTLGILAEYLPSLSRHD